MVLSAVTYHYGSSDASDPTYYSQYTTYRPRYGNAQPLTVTGPNDAPGWNTVDIAFSPEKIQIYYNGNLYATAEGSYITGKPAYLVFDDVSATGENTLRIPGEVLVRYVRIFSRPLRRAFVAQARALLPRPQLRQAPLRDRRCRRPGTGYRCAGTPDRHELMKVDATWPHPRV